MTPTVLLFDVDGTLIRTGGAGRRAIERALSAHGAAGSAEFSFAGMTDRAIVRRALVSAHMPATEETIAAVLSSYLERLAEEVAGAPDDEYRICPGVVAVLDRLAPLADIAIGLGTGNLERGAAIKLARVRLADRFAFGGYGSDAELRDELLRIGAERGARRLGARASDCRVVVIGDTPKDIAAAKAIGAQCLAVATGPVSIDELARHLPSFAVESLDGPDAVAALLGTLA